MYSTAYGQCRVAVAGLCVGLRYVYVGLCRANDANDVGVMCNRVCAPRKIKITARKRTKKGRAVISVVSVVAKVVIVTDVRLYAADILRAFGETFFYGGTIWCSTDAEPRPAACWAAPCPRNAACKLSSLGERIRLTRAKREFLSIANRGTPPQRGNKEPLGERGLGS